MGVYEIEVGVALRRPPRVDEYRKYLVAAESPLAAELVACQWAAATCVMPVSSRLVVAEFGTEADRDGRLAA